MTTEQPDVLKLAEPWMQQCSPHDVGVDSVGCACPPDGDPRPIVSALAAEVEELRARIGHGLPPEQREGHAYNLGAEYEAAAPSIGTFIGWLAYRHENERLNNKILRSMIEGLEQRLKSAHEALTRVEDDDPDEFVTLKSTIEWVVRSYRGLKAEHEKLLAIAGRVEALLCDPHREPPPNGTLIVRGRSGGWQNLPYEERVFVRADRTEGAYPDGDWCPIEGDDQRPWQFGEIHALDDPACDRVSVSLEPYVHVDDIARALAGGAA